MATTAAASVVAVKVVVVVMAVAAAVVAVVMGIVAAGGLAIALHHGRLVQPSMLTVAVAVTSTAVAHVTLVVTA
jgi:hypothetical protein